MNKKRFYVLITKSQAEKLSKSEQKELDKLIASDPDLKEEAEFISEFWSGTEFAIEAEGDTLFERISSEIDPNPAIPLESNRYKRERGFRRIFTLSRVAASIVFFLVSGILAFFIAQHMRKNANDLVAETQIKYVEKTVSSGQRLRIFLPDGSMVWLNSQSKIIYPESFTGSTRMVELEGEAFFEVSKDKDKPFIVKSGELTTTALGTSFNIRAYNPESSIYVTLVTGKVLVELNKKEDAKFILNPGFGVQYSKELGSISREKHEIDKIIGWKDGILRFDSDDFDTVIKKLSRWYGVEFTFEGLSKIDKEWRFTGWFQNDYLDVVLKSMSFTKGFEYKIDNKKVTIKFN